MLVACLTFGGIVIVAILSFVFILNKRGGEFNMAWKGPGISGLLHYKEADKTDNNKSE